ncbi:MAG: class I tRNA ligase family protein, partial [Verrucomicrobiota bacterium]
RMASQATMARIFDRVARLLAPILAFTADEAWEYAGREGSVHQEDFPTPDPDFSGTDAIETMEGILRVRDAAQAKVDQAIKAGMFKKRERASVILKVSPKDPVYALLEEETETVLEVLMLSEYVLEEGLGDEIRVEVEETRHAECPRCRRSLPLLKNGLCARCSEVMAAFEESVA